MNKNIKNDSHLSLMPLTIKNISQNCHKWFKDPDVNRYLEIRHNPPKTIEAIIGFAQECEKIKRHHWGIFVNSNHIGMVSCSDYGPKQYNWVDISIIIGDKSYWKQGYAKLALVGAVDYLFSIGRFHRIQAGTYNVNSQCVELFKKIGFSEEGFLRDAAKVGRKYVGIIKLGLLKNEWNPNKKYLSKVIVKKMKWE